MAQRVVFNGRDASYLPGLWVSDGTTVGTYELLVAGASSSYGLNPYGFSSYNGMVLFSGYDAGDHVSLWETNGTSAGTAELSVAGASSSYSLNPDDITSYNGKVLFSGYNAYGQAGLWVSDGTTAGTSELSVAGASSNGLNPSWFTSYNGKLLFSGYDAGGKLGLWVSDGTAAGTFKLSVAGANSTYGLSPVYFTLCNGKLLFAAYDARNQNSLWVSDGTAAGTYELLVAGASSSYGLNPYGFSSYNGMVLFSGYDAGDHVSLWETNGTSAGTAELSVAGASSNGLDPSSFTILNGKTLFSGYDTTNLRGLWATNGSGVGTAELSVAGASSSYGLNPDDITSYNGEVLFSGYNAGDQLGLWVSDGTAAGTSELSVAGASSTGLDPYGFTSYNGKLVFSGYDAGGQLGLWVSDGTAAGTSELSVAGTDSSYDLKPNSLIAVDIAGPATFIALQATPSAAGPLNAGRMISFTLTPSAAVTATTTGGSPTLSLSDGGTATFDAAATTATALVFSTTVATGQDTPDLKVTGLGLNGATIADAVGNPLDALALPTLMGSDTRLVIDTIAPAVSSLALSVTENGPATAIGIAAPTDPNYSGAALTITVGALPADGSVILADGVTAVAAGQILTAAQLAGLLFKPTIGQFRQSSSFGYTVADPAGNSSAATAALAIGPAIGNPVTSASALGVAEDGPATAIGIAAPADPNYSGASLTITVGALPADGSVILADGVTAVAAGQILTAAQLAGLLFKPTIGQFGQSSSFGYTVADPAGNSSAATAALAIGPAIGNPVTSASALGMAEDGPATAIGIAAPADPNYKTGQLTVTAVILPSDGRITLADGITTVTTNELLTSTQLTGLLFKPTTGQFGQSSSFGYTVSDPTGNSSAGSATLTIGPALGNPAISSPALTVAENGPATAIGIAAPTDPNYTAAQLTITIGALPTDGAITLADGVTAVAGQVLIGSAQLTGLLFKPTTGQFSKSSTFGYTVADPAGNSSTGSATLAIGPAAPTALALAPASDSGVAGDGITNLATPTITGAGTPGDTVSLYNAGALVGSATVDAAGAWSVTPTLALADGPHTLTATQHDTAGNVSAASPPLTVTIDTVVVAAPTLVDASTVSSPAEPVLSGFALAGATVTVLDGATPLSTATASGSGAWSLALPAPLAAGAHTLAATTADVAGNVSPASPPLSVQVDAAGGYAATAPPDAASDTTTGRYDATSRLFEIDRNNAAGQLLQSVTDTVANLNIYSGAGTLIGTVAQPSSGVTSQPLFGTTPQPLAATSGTGPVGSTVTLLSQSNVLTTQGDDTVHAGGGSDTIYATGGATSVVGGAGSLLFVAGAGRSTVTGGSGSSTLFGGAGGGYLGGGSSGHNVLVGSGGNTTLVGGGLGDILVGAAGQAVLYADDGSAEFGGSGSATMFGADGVMVGGAGSNLMVAGPNGPEAMWAGSGNSTLFGAPGNAHDTLVGAAVGRTTMVGGAGSTQFVDLAGQATAYGGGGDDTFFATGGGMTIVEGAGADEVLFGAGANSVAGGAGTDLYDVVQGAAGGADVVSGFKAGADQVRLFGYDLTRVTQNVAAGSLTLGLADGTRITLVGVTHLGANDVV